MISRDLARKLAGLVGKPILYRLKHYPEKGWRRGSLAGVKIMCGDMNRLYIGIEGSRVVEFDLYYTEVKYDKWKRERVPRFGWRELKMGEVIQKGDIFYGCDPPDDPPRYHKIEWDGVRPKSVAMGYRYFRRRDVFNKK